MQHPPSRPTGEHDSGGTDKVTVLYVYTGYIEGCPAKLGVKQ